MTKTAEQFDTEADVILEECRAEFAAFFDKMIARCTTFTEELNSSDISPTFKLAVARKLLTGIDKALDAAVELKS